jgi:hypothetical protein
MTSDRMERLRLRKRAGREEIEEDSKIGAFLTDSGDIKHPSFTEIWGDFALRVLTKQCRS